MTVKRRLFISNILMIVVPVTLCAVLAAVMSLAAFGGRSFGDERFYQAKNSIAALDAAAYDGDGLLSVADAIAQKYGNDHIAVFVYGEGRPLGAPAPAAPLLPAALAAVGTHTLTLDRTALFVRVVGEYHIILANTDYYSADDMSYLRYRVITGFVLFILIAAIIFLTNRILTRVMVKSIMTPIDTLSYGVGQIRDGNLGFRLDYSAKDEFEPVCAAFNGMADRLQWLEDARHKDEESRKELIAGISHDLRTPLTSIKAYLEGIENGVAKSPERLQKYLGTIKSKADDLEHIISRLFLFSKLDIGEFPMDTEPADIGSAILGISNGLADEYRSRGLTLTVGAVTRGVFANIDKVWLRNVIINILENSAKYKTAEKGTVLIECARTDANVEIRLTDDGPGVPTDALGKLFDVFYRVDPARNTKGSGLGLAISARVVGHMGGSMSARLPREGGLEITVRLPIVPK
jgi:signal transduction histidine kinase